MGIRACSSKLKIALTIDSAKISLSEGKYNKFAPNGTGKSTIARAVLLGTN